MLLGVHLIARNEERVIGRCLDSLAGYVDEIVVGDTGSTDGTKDIVRQYGARVVDLTWQDDFAAARNALLLHSRTIWVLVIDADEWVMDGEAIRSAREWLRSQQSSAARVQIDNYTNEEHTELVSYEAVRLLRADQGLEYAGAIHEQLVRPSSREGLASYAYVDGPLCGIRLGHDGYVPRIMAAKAKAERNRRILEGQLAQGIGGAFARYNMGVTLCQLGRWGEACTSFLAACESVPLYAAYRPVLMLDTGRAMLQTGQHDEAERLLRPEAARYSDYPDLQLLYGQCLQRLGMLPEAAAAYRAAVQAGLELQRRRGTGGSHMPEATEVTELTPAAKLTEVTESIPAVVSTPAASQATHYILSKGAATYQAYTALADVTHRLGEAAEALKLYMAALREEPTHADAQSGMANLLQQAGMSDEAIHHHLESYIAAGYQQDYTRLQTTVASRLTGIGGYIEALPLWRSQLDALNPAQRKQYIECLMGTGQYGEAARLLRLQTMNGEPADEQMELDLILCCWTEGHLVTGSAGVVWGEEPMTFELRLALMSRAVQLGMVRLAAKLASREERLGEELDLLLYDQGYVQAAAYRLLERMERGPLLPAGLFRLAEILYNRHNYNEALALMEQAAEGVTEAEQEQAGSLRTRAYLGEASCCAALALEAIQLLYQGEAEAAVQDRGALDRDAVKLRASLQRLLGTGWKTEWNGVQRRRMQDHGGAEADFLMHDREE
ncbi:glycosyltransferase [Paenibacillus sp. GCM10023252]|uniref:glycosyltransferase n=1 Tax=Paenibacillus sp. GCM10023252 TaxID=3252649 RepID=UPI00360F0400